MASQETAWSVSDVAAAVRGALAEGLPAKIRVVGEVSNLSDRQHWFFSLKDAGASLRCVMFASAARKVRFPLRDGLEVVCTGRIDFYDAQGAVQLYVDKIEPVGQGALELELRRLIAELRELGYFGHEHKRELPAFPRRIAVVTSRGAAALQDVINTAHQRWPGCELLLYDVRVQGDDAAPMIAKAIRKLSAQGKRLGIDAVILTRGGGSIEDLWAFNERVVADAVFKCKLPVVAAIGHEIDTTVAELVADLRCATPTQAAMTLVPDAEALSEQVTQIQRRLNLTLRRHLDASRVRLQAIKRHALFAKPERLIRDAGDDLDAAAERLQSATPRRLAQAKERLTALQKHLEAVGPQSVLGRGYTYTSDDAGRVLRSAAKVKPGDRLVTAFADGKVTSTVEAADAPAKPTKKAPRRKPDRPTGGTLFG